MHSVFQGRKPEWEALCGQIKQTAAAGGSSSGAAWEQRAKDAEYKLVQVGRGKGVRWAVVGCEDGVSLVKGPGEMVGRRQQQWRCMGAAGQGCRVQAGAGGEGPGAGRWVGGEVGSGKVGAEGASEVEGPRMQSTS